MAAAVAKVNVVYYRWVHLAIVLPFAVHRFAEDKASP